MNGRCFIQPPVWYEEDEDLVYQVLRPLYCIPSSARALHLTLSKWFKDNGFVTAGFEDSLWIREAGGKYADRLIFSAHIYDTLMACKSLPTLNQFKQDFLTRFDGTDEGPVTSHLGCEIIRDRANRAILYRQLIYTKKILQLYGAWDKPLVRTPLEPGKRLSKDNCPSYVDPALH